MGSVVVGVDVSGDHVARLLERLELLAPDAAFLELAEPGLDEGLALGVAVAAAAMRDAVLGQAGAERPRGQGGAVVGPERQLAGPDLVGRDRSVDDSGGLLRATADVQAPARDLPGAAVDDRVQITPAVLGDPD